MEAGPEDGRKEDPDLHSFPGERRKIIQPTSLRDPKLEKLKEVLLDWINRSLKVEHIVVQSLEEDLYDGLVLHHLLARLAGVRLPLEEIALSSSAQVHKLQRVLRELERTLGPREDDPARWSVELIHQKDLLATLHLLVAMATRLQPELQLPADVQVEVLDLQVSRNGIKSEVTTEVLTGPSSDSLCKSHGGDPVDHLLNQEAHKVDVVKKALVNFVNQTMFSLGLQVADLDKQVCGYRPPETITSKPSDDPVRVLQFADGVILLLLIGQLEGFFVPLCHYSLTPVNQAEMLHNVTLALDLLSDLGLLSSPIDPQDIVSQDVSATLRVLLTLFRKHRGTREPPEGGAHKTEGFPAPEL
ncbi:LOW QUALITY PROTEIN: gamma-parvin [Neosynchiropus ocellatus]